MCRMRRWLGRAVFSGRRFLMTSASDASVCAAGWGCGVPALPPLHLSCTILYELSFSSVVRPSIPLSIYRRSLSDAQLFIIHRPRPSLSPVSAARYPHSCLPSPRTGCSSATVAPPALRFAPSASLGSFTATPCLIVLCLRLLCRSSVRLLPCPSVALSLCLCLRV